MMIKTTLSHCLILLISLSLLSLKADEADSYGEPHYGIALFGSKNLKSGPNEPFYYVNPNAPQGGHITVARSGDYTKLNRWSLRGTPLYEINDFCFESPMKLSHGNDEPYSLYAGLAQSVELAKDKKSLIFNINPLAHFSDGHPVTAEDFEFSYHLLFDPGFVPTMKRVFADVKSVEVLNSHRIRFRFHSQNKESPLALAERLEIYPKHIYGAPGKNFAEDFNEMPPVATGPYLVKDFQLGKYITLEKDPNWWGKDLPINKGCFNFKTITYKYYKDKLTRREALKSGEIDCLGVGSPKSWMKEFSGIYTQKNYLVREALSHDRIHNIQGMIFNLRRRHLKDKWVRKAISAVFDHEWTNRELYFNQFARSQGAFDSNADFVTKGPPTGKVLETLQELRKKYNDDVPYSALTRSQSPPGSNMAPQEALEFASLLLDKAGWKISEDGIRSLNGKKLILHIPIIQEQGYESLLEPFVQRLKKVGVLLKLVNYSTATWTKKRKEFDFDLIFFGYNYPGNRNPGIKHRAWWSSSLANQPGSHNVMGLVNQATDEALERIIASTTRKDQLIWAEVLSRIIAASDIYIPLFYSPEDWIVYWNRLSHGEIYASNYDLRRNVLKYWWIDPEKDQKLKQSMLKQIPFVP